MKITEKKIEKVCKKVVGFVGKKIDHAFLDVFF
jgi:hypothetical protein